VALSGVYLTAGPHQVKLVYAPDSFLLGGAITLLTGLGLLGWAGFTWLRKRGKTRPALTEAKLYQEEANKN